VDHADDKRRDTYVALHEWHTRTGEPLDWEQVIFPDEVLAWASADPEVSQLLRHHYGHPTAEPPPSHVPDREDRKERR
jgi:hypothetical protein